MCCNGLLECVSREQQADIAKAGMCVVEASIDSAAGEGLMLQGAELVAALRRSLPASDANRCVAACCGVLRCVVVCCGMLQCVAVCCSVLQYAAVCCNVLQCVAVCCSVLQCVAVALHALCH